MAQTAPMQDESTQGPGARRRARLLVVEDDARMRRVLELLLSDHWDVDVASDGREALELAERNPPDLVLTDLILPGIDGFELTRELRAAPRTCAVPIVVISGLTEEADRLRALEAGANDFLIKPFSERELYLRVTTHLEMASLRREAALRETEAHVRLLLDGALDAVVSTDAADVITYWNPQAEKTFGWTAEEALGRRFGELILRPEPRQDHDRDMERFLATGEAPSVNRRTEVEGQRKDGTRVPLELAITVVRVWDAWTFNVFARDITERQAGRRGAHPAPAEGAGSRPHQGRVPGPALPRAAHAALRHRGMGAHAAHERARRGDPRARHRDHRPQREAAEPAHRGHPRRLADRGRQVPRRDALGRPGEGARGRPRHRRPHGRGRGRSTLAARRPGARRRSPSAIPTACSRSRGTCCRTPSSSRRPGARCRSSSRRSGEFFELTVRGHRRRDRSRLPAPHLRAVPPGRRVRRQAPRRPRAGPVHRPPHRGDARRHGGGPERGQGTRDRPSWSGSPRWTPARTRSPRSDASGRKGWPTRRGWTACASWSSTTRPTPATSSRPSSRTRGAWSSWPPPPPKR